MAKGLCCRVQADGNLGKNLVIPIHKKDGTISHRCGVCEIRPSCRDPQKRVFAFRFLHSQSCRLAAAKCVPTQAGIAQYDRTAAEERTSPTNPLEYLNGARPYPLPPGAPPALPYTLPLA